MIGLVKDINGNNRFFGKYRGFIVDIEDPKRMGRIRARVPEILGDISTDWALPVLPSGGGPDTGTTTTLRVGARVWIEFERGLIDKPLFVGFWGAQPDGVSDLPRLSREDDSDPATTGQKGQDTATTHTGDEVSEPDPEAVGKYPRVNAQRTPKGMVREMDDSGPRMQDFHPSNTYREVRSDGTVVDKSVKDKHEIVQEQLLRHVKSILEVIDEDYIQTVIGKIDEESDERNINVKTLLTGLIRQIQLTIENGADLTVNSGALSLAAAASALTLTLASLTIDSSGSISITAPAISLLGTITVGGPLLPSSSFVELGASGGNALLDIRAIQLIDASIAQANGDGGTYVPGTLLGAISSFSTQVVKAS